VDRIDAALADAHWKQGHRPFLHSVCAHRAVARGSPQVQAQDHGLDQALDHRLIEKAAPALEFQTPVTGSFAIRNVHRTVGAMLAGKSPGATGRLDCLRARFTTSSPARRARASEPSCRTA